MVENRGLCLAYIRVSLTEKIQSYIHLSPLTIEIHRDNIKNKLGNLNQKQISKHF